MNDDKKEHENFVEAITEELLSKLDRPQAIAVLSSVITNIYNGTDKNSAFILAQPDTQVAVVTTSLATLEHLPDVIAKTFESLKDLENNPTSTNDETTTPPKERLH